MSLRLAALPRRLWMCLVCGANIFSWIEVSRSWISLFRRDTVESIYCKIVPGVRFLLYWKSWRMSSERGIRLRHLQMHVGTSSSHTSWIPSVYWGTVRSIVLFDTLWLCVSLLATPCHKIAAVWAAIDMHGGDHWKRRAILSGNTRGGRNIFQQTSNDDTQAWLTHYAHSMESRETYDREGTVWFFSLGSFCF